MRRATGLCVYRVVAVPHSVINALIETDRINEADALDRRKVEFALAELISDFGKRWQ
jgi:hypothetical protein